MPFSFSVQTVESQELVIFFSGPKGTVALEEIFDLPHEVDVDNTVEKEVFQVLLFLPTNSGVHPEAVLRINEPGSETVVTWTSHLLALTYN